MSIAICMSACVYSVSHILYITEAGPLTKRTFIKTTSLFAIVLILKFMITLRNNDVVLIKVPTVNYTSCTAVSRTYRDVL